jgi:hypothetical protein
MVAVGNEFKRGISTFAEIFLDLLRRREQSDRSGSWSVASAPDEQHRVLPANGAIDAAHKGVDVFVHPVFVVGVDALGEPLADRFQRSVAIAHGTLLSRARGLLNALPDVAPLKLCGPPATQLDHRMSSTR